MGLGGNSISIPSDIFHTLFINTAGIGLVLIGVIVLAVSSDPLSRTNRLIILCKWHRTECFRGDYRILCRLSGINRGICNHRRNRFSDYTGIYILSVADKKIGEEPACPRNDSCKMRGKSEIALVGATTVCVLDKDETVN